METVQFRPCAFLRPIGNTIRPNRKILFGCDRKQAQIDIVVTSAKDDRGIIGSCKFRRNFIAENELQLMEEYADAMGHLGYRYYYLFFGSDFNTSCLGRAGNEEVRLITLRNMYETDS